VDAISGLAANVGLYYHRSAGFISSGLCVPVPSLLSQREFCGVRFLHLILKNRAHVGGHANARSSTMRFGRSSDPVEGVQNAARPGLTLIEREGQMRGA